MGVAIHAVGLGKTYRIVSAHDAAYRTFREDVSRLGQRLVARDRGGSSETVEALRDVSFDLATGEALGIIGRNGAGKSTLLKVLSRVTPPTSGYADVSGRVGALLDVGTGFHPELTGRENVFLSGAILGLSRREVAARFDEIVDFAEVGRFIDTPVKRYSSGMYARLGFAVAAHLRPAVLMVDEVLSVGDLAFQARCLAHMKRLTEAGTGVLFVSHNLLSVADFCDRALMLDRGSVINEGPAAEVASVYKRLLTAGAIAQESNANRLAVQMNGQQVPGHATHEPGHPIRLGVVVERPQGTRDVAVALNLVIESAEGQPVMHLRSDVSGSEIRVGPGARTIGVDIDDPSLAPGSYSVYLRVVSMQPDDEFILDSERILLDVPGDRRLTSMISPRHRFYSQLAASPQGTVSDA